MEAAEGGDCHAGVGSEVGLGFADNGFGLGALGGRVGFYVAFGGGGGGGGGEGEGGEEELGGF